MAETNPQAQKAEPPKPVKAQAQIPEELSKQLDEIMRRLRLLEDRYSGLRTKSQFTEQNLLKDTKSVFEEINILNSTITELKSEISELNERFIKLTEEVRNCVDKTEFNTLSKYIDFWQPLNFITKKEAEQLIKEIKGNKTV